MGEKTVSVRVRFEGGDSVKAGLQEVGREGTKALETISASSGRTGAALQNAGYQVSDFFVQVSGGTEPTRALAQQLPQLLQGFGLIGVAASVAIAVLPGLWSLFGGGADSAEALKEQIEATTDAIQNYGKAADLAAEPMDRLIEKYGTMAGAVREARVQAAELARAEALRSVTGVMRNNGFDAGELNDINARLALKQDFRQPSAEMYKIAGMASEANFKVRELQRQFALTADEALVLAQASAQVRDSADQSASAQVAALGLLKERLIEVFGSADAANQATSGMLDDLNAAVIAAADVASIDMASGINSAADQALRLADNLRAASLNYGKIQNTGESGPDAARRSVMDLNTVNITGTLASGAGGVYKPPSASAGGGGGTDPDVTRAVSLTAAVRTEAEKYADALAEINRLKEKGLITDETYNRQLEKLGEGLDGLSDLGKKAAGAIRTAFDGLFDDPAEALKNLAKQLAMMALYAQLGRSFPTIFGASGIIPLGIKGYASGGHHRGGLRIVGENGPELEATGPSMIYPNDMLRSLGQGGSTSVEVHNYGGGAVETKQDRGPDGSKIIRVMVGKDIGSGKHDSVLRSRYGSKPRALVR